MDDRDDLVQALEAAGCVIRGTGVRCAFHGDRNSSGSIYQGQDGRWRYRCHACEAKGDAADIQALHTGRPLAEILKETRARENPMPTSHPTRDQGPRRFQDLDALVASLGDRVVEVYRYTHPTTRAVELAVIRLNPKAFPQATPAPGGGWWLKGLVGVQPIYNRERVRAADLVVVVEGEKDVKALHRADVVATTAPMGADAISVSVDEDGKPGKADWSALAGKQVVLWGDNDEPGHRHLQRVARILGRLHPRPTLLRVRPDDLAGAKDAADLVEAAELAGGAEAARIAVQRVIDGALPIHAAAALHHRIEDAIAGRLASLPWPWPSIGGATQALIPGSVTLLVGAPGASKSFMLLQAALWWTGEGHRVALYELEEDQAFHLHRAMALESGRGAVTDPAWLRSNPDEARTLMARHSRQLDAIAATMSTAPPQGISLQDLAAWVEHQAASGCRIICADPITIASVGDAKPWIAAEDFMRAAKGSVAKHGASLVLTSHGRKGDARGRAGAAPDLDSLAGGSAYSRFASTVLWLEASEAEQVLVVDADGRERMAEVNRRVRILKARSGRGTGMTIGMHFDSGTLRTSEEGIIVTASERSRKVDARLARPKGRRPEQVEGGSDRAARMLANPSEAEDAFNGNDDRQVVRL